MLDVQATDSSYDKAGNLKMHQGPAFTYTYAANSHLIDQISSKLGASGPVMQMTREYDHLQRQTSVAAINSGTMDTLAGYSYTHNVLNQRETKTKPKDRNNPVHVAAR